MAKSVLYPFLNPVWESDKGADRSVDPSRCHNTSLSSVFRTNEDNVIGRKPYPYSPAYLALARI